MFSTAARVGQEPIQTQISSLKATLSVNPQSLSPDAKKQVIVSSLIGAVLGIVVSLIVNSTLVEISVSPFFSLYFGLLFLAVGSIIMWRLHAVTASQPLTNAEANRKNQLQFFAWLIMVSGGLCFVLERHWFVGVPYLVKIPLYTLLGISVSFALTFALVDVLNYAGGFVQMTYARPLVESQPQVFLVLTTSLIMGGLFGFIFGVMDVEDAAQYTIALALKKEEHMCYPIGIVLGGLAGFGNEILRIRGEEYSALQDTQFDDDI